MDATGPQLQQPMPRQVPHTRDTDETQRIAPWPRGPAHLQLGIMSTNWAAQRCNLLPQREWSCCSLSLSIRNMSSSESEP